VSIGEKKERKTLTEWLKETSDAEWCLITVKEKENEL